VRPVEDRIRDAMTAGAEELWNVVKDPHPEVIENAIYNRHFTEDMAIFLVKKKNISAGLLSVLAADRRFKDSYKLKLLLCRHPATPQRVVISLLKFLRIFDLSDITKDRHVHINIRRKIEFIISEKLKSMPAGIKIALARRANSNTILNIMEYGDESVVKVCLENPSLTEGHICRIINRPATGAAVIRLIAADEKWTLRYFVRYALIRNVHAPLVNVVRFIPGMKTIDLRDLYSDPKLPLSTRPFIFRELSDRGESEALPPDEIYNLSEDDAVSSDQ
jgi:hypothetical protein